MSFEHKEHLPGLDRDIEKAIEELGLHTRDGREDKQKIWDGEKKSPSEIAIDRFRSEYSKRIRAASTD